MVGDRPVDLVTYTQQTTDHLTPNCSASELRPLFCQPSNETNEWVNCDPYFMQMSRKILPDGQPAIRAKSAITGISSGAFFGLPFSIFPNTIYYLQIISGRNIYVSAMCYRKILAKRIEPIAHIHAPLTMCSPM